MRATPPPKPLRTYKNLSVLTCKVPKVTKTSGVIQARNNWTQYLGVCNNALNLSLSNDHSGEWQRKHGHKTNYEDKEERKEKPTIFVCGFSQAGGSETPNSKANKALTKSLVE